MVPRSPLTNTVTAGSLLLIVFIPNFIYIIVGEDILSLTRQVGFLIFAVCLNLIPVFCLGKWSGFYFKIMYPFALLAPLNVAYLILYKYPITDGALGAILDTNYHEATEFFSGFAIAIVGMVTAMLCIGFLYYYLIKKFETPFRFRTNLVLAVLSIVVILIASLAFHTGPKDMADASRWDAFKTRLAKIYPWGLIMHTVKYLNDNIHISSHAATVDGLKIRSEKKSPISYREIYVFILGEAARFDRFSINGYSKPTDPYLQKMTKLAVFSDVCTQATITRMAVPPIMTGVGLEYLSEAFGQPSVVTYFKKAGYKTYWFSNQRKMDIWDNATSVYANEADQVVYFNKSLTDSTDVQVKYDGVMVPALKELVTRSDLRKIFAVFHMMGSHWRYDRRYPVEFDVYKPSGKGLDNLRFDDPSTKDMKNFSYDNSILYTDYFIANVIDIIAESGAVGTVTFLSDHGEDLFDNEKNLFGHGNQQVSTFVAKVPLFVWYTDLYYSVYSGKIEAMLNNKNKKVSTASIFASLLDMADIGFEGEDLAKSIFSSKFSVSPRKIISTRNKIVDCDSLP